MTEGVIIEELRVIENKNTLIFTFGTGDNYRKIKAISFGKVDYFKDLLSDLFDKNTCDKIISGVLGNIVLKFDIVYFISINEFNNNVSVQLKLKDFRFSN